MNIVLFQDGELDRLLPQEDARARHVLDVIGCKEGDSFDVGLIDGPRGKARIARILQRGLQLDFNFATEVPDLYPVELIVGLPRPPSARRILKDLTTQGVKKMHFVATDKGEKSYLNSRLWAGGEYRRLLQAGAEQAFCTRLPEVNLHESLTDCITNLSYGERLALDNYEADASLGSLHCIASSYILAVGAERGWSGGERNALREGDFTLVSLGSRVLKTETACIVGLALVLEKLKAY